VEDGGDLRMSDLSSETGSDVIRGYERKIDSLMTEVGELKNEVFLLIRVCIQELMGHVTFHLVRLICRGPSMK
jgi:hypothetical protein